MPSPLNVLYLQYNNPGAYPPIIHSSQLLRSEGYRISMIGVVFASTADISVPRQCYDDIKLLKAPSNRVFNKLFFAWFCIRTVVYSMRVNPDVLYISDHPACMAGYILSKIFRVKMVYHEHDTPIPSRGGFDRVVLRCRQEIARDALCCIIPNSRRAENFVHHVGPVKELHVVWNCPGDEDLEQSAKRRNRQVTTDEVKLFYVGTLNKNRLPFTLLDAMERVHQVSLYLIGYETIGSKGFCEELKKRASSKALADRINVIGALETREEIFEYLMSADVCLSLVPMDDNHGDNSGMVGASNKAFDALVCGVPILVCDLPDWRTSFVDAGVALACDPRDVNSICAALEWFRDNAAAASKMGQAGRSRIESDWNYSSQFVPVIKTLKTFFGGSSDRLRAYQDTDL